jgi:hypothetical protein
MPAERDNAELHLKTIGRQPIVGTSVFAYNDDPARSLCVTVMVRILASMST